MFFCCQSIQHHKFGSWHFARGKNNRDYVAIRPNLKCIVELDQNSRNSVLIYRFRMVCVCVCVFPLIFHHSIAIIHSVSVKQFALCMRALSAAVVETIPLIWNHRAPDDFDSKNTQMINDCEMDST